MLRETALAALVCTIALGCAACDNRGPAEKAGAKVDETVRTLKNGGEKTPEDKVRDAVDDARSDAKDAANDVKKDVKNH